MLNEMQQDNIASYILPSRLMEKRITLGIGLYLAARHSLVPDAYSALPFVMIGQTISLLASRESSVTPDDTSPTGTVNRVVKGVTIYEYE